jgi:exonuclease SbcD
MADGGFYIRTERADLTTLGAPIILTSSTGESVEVVCLPFLEPNRVDLAEEQGDRTHENVLRVALEHQRTMVVDPTRAIVMAHTFVGGGEASKSERDLVSVGGSSTVNHRLFDGFGYVALGHLHRPQRFGASGNVVYSGSPIPYSFSEEHQKSVVILDTTKMTSTTIAVGIGRGVVTIRGELNDLLTSPKHKHAELLYVRVELTDDQLKIGAMESIRARFPHALELDQAAINGDGSIKEIVGGKARSVAEEVADYMDEYFEATQHRFKHELADKAVAQVINSAEV